MESTPPPVDNFLTPFIEVREVKLTQGGSIFLQVTLLKRRSAAEALSEAFQGQLDIPLPIFLVTEKPSYSFGMANGHNVPGMPQTEAKLIETEIYNVLAAAKVDLTAMEISGILDHHPPQPVRYTADDFSKSYYRTGAFFAAGDIQMTAHHPVKGRRAATRFVPVLFQTKTGSVYTNYLSVYGPGTVIWVKKPTLS